MRRHEVRNSFDINDQLPVHENVRAESFVDLNALVANGNPGLPFKGNPCLVQLIFCSLFTQSAVGRVEKGRVRLQRVIPFFRNSFKPIFVGKFDDATGVVFLKGRFATFMFSRISMTIWFCFALIWSMIAAITAVISVTNFAHRAARRQCPTRPTPHPPSAATNARAFAATVSALSPGL